MELDAMSVNAGVLCHIVEDFGVREAVAQLLRARGFGASAGAIDRIGDDAQAFELWADLRAGLRDTIDAIDELLAEGAGA